jgi:hypothetical protein
MLVTPQERAVGLYTRLSRSPTDSGGAGIDR